MDGGQEGGMWGLSFLDDQDKRGKKRLSSFPQPLSKNTKITTWDPSNFKLLPTLDILFLNLPPRWVILKW